MSLGFTGFQILIAHSPALPAPPFYSLPFVNAHREDSHRFQKGFPIYSILYSCIVLTYLPTYLPTLTPARLTYTYTYSISSPQLPAATIQTVTNCRRQLHPIK